MIGTEIGPWYVESEIGSGGMGVVYLARATKPVLGLERDDPVALKLIHAYLLETPGFVTRFLREARIGREVYHPNVVRTYECDAIQSERRRRPYLVMEYVKGQTLRKLLEDLRSVPEELCRHVAFEIAQGLRAIHEAGAVHRDLKADNVLITREHAVKIMDLGVARLQDEVIRLSRSGHFVGSLHYAPPEAFNGKRVDVDGRGDLYSLGVLLYELVTGTHPFRHDDVWTVLWKVMEESPRRVGELVPHVSPFFEDVIHTLCEKDPNRRFQSAERLAEVLREGEPGAWWQERLAQRVSVGVRRRHAPSVRRETSLHGRDEALDALQRLFDEAALGRGRVALVEGEAGIGKTRLVEEFVAVLEQRSEDAHVLFGSYPPGALTASGAFASAYREHFDRGDMHSRIQRYLASTPLLVPATIALLRGEPPPRGAPPLGWDTLVTVFVHATQGMAAESPVIVVIDDLHFAPDEGRALFAAMARAVAGQRILLIGTMRPEVPATWLADLTALEATSRIHLGRLGAKDLMRMLVEAFHSERLARDLGFPIAQKTDGNPYFVLEVIRELKEEGLIEHRPDGTWSATGVIQDLVVPSTVMDLVRARISALSTQERNLLDVAACCGFEFDPLLVADVLELERIPALQAFASIESHHHLVRATGRRFVFDHHQIQEVLYESLHDQLREAYHAAIADVLSARAGAVGKDPSTLSRDLCLALCENYLLGGRPEKGVPYLGFALVHLEQNYRHEAASALADRALRVPALLEGEARIRILLRLGEQLERLGRRDDEARVRQEAAGLADELGDPTLRAEAHRAYGHHLERSHADAEALEELNLALALAKEADEPAIVAAALACSGNVHLLHGRLERARLALDEALRIHGELGDVRGEAGALLDLGNVDMDLGAFQDALRHYRSSLARSRELGDREAEAQGLGSVGAALLALGRVTDAEQHHQMALDACQDTGARREEIAQLLGLARIARLQGDPDAASDRASAALTIARELGDGAAEAFAHGTLGGVAWFRGRLAEALEHAESQVELLEDLGDRAGEADGLENRGVLGVFLGDAERARADLDAALRIASDLGLRLVHATTLLDLGRLAYFHGDPEGALVRVEDAVEAVRGLGTASGLAAGLGLLGSVRRALDRTDAALAAFEEQEALGRANDLPTAVALASFGKALLASDAASARAAFEAAAPRLAAVDRLAVLFDLWRISGDEEDLAVARRALNHLLAYAPEGCPRAMLATVSLFRDIVVASRRR